MTSSPNNNDSKGFRLSIWLMPAAPEREHLTKMIAGFAESAAFSVPFDPHITLVGGVPCASEDYLRETLVPSLRQGLEKAGQRITCRCSTTPVYKDKWNQACALVVEESPEFAQLVGLCRDICVNDSCDKEWYPPPLGKPHLSLFYGEEGAPSEEEVKRGLGADGPTFSFKGSQVTIWKNDPPTLEGVAKWEELAVIDLPPGNGKSSL